IEILSKSTMSTKKLSDEMKFGVKYFICCRAEMVGISNRVCEPLAVLVHIAFHNLQKVLIWRRKTEDPGIERWPRGYQNFFASSSALSFSRMPTCALTQKIWIKVRKRT